MLNHVNKRCHRAISQGVLKPPIHQSNLTRCPQDKTADISQTTFSIFPQWEFSYLIPLWWSLFLRVRLIINRNDIKALPKPMLAYCRLDHMGTDFSEIQIEIHTFSFKKMRFEISSAKLAVILSRGRWVELEWQWQTELVILCDVNFVSFHFSLFMNMCVDNENSWESILFHALKGFTQWYGEV